MAEQQVVVFHLGQEEYCLPIGQVREIIQYQGATKLPGAPGHFEGIINLRGKIIPVIDLAKKFQLAAASGERQALIVEVGDNSLGVIVDSVTEVIRLQDGAIEVPPAQAASAGSCVRGIGKTGERLLILLDQANLADLECRSLTEAAG